MPNLEQKTLLDPNHYIRTIKTHEDFLTDFPDADRSQMDKVKRRELLGRAVGNAAISIANEMESDPTKPDLEAHIFRLVGEVEPFYRSKQKVDKLLALYKNNPSTMPEYHKRQYYDAKEYIFDFNDTLHDIISDGGMKIGFDELVGFMMKMHGASSGPEDMAHFQQTVTDQLVGMRDEVNFGLILEDKGIKYRRATRDEEKEGDVFIGVTAIDLKSSPGAVERGKEKARNAYHSATHLLWSHIKPSDYGPRLALPLEMYDVVWDRVQNDLRAIVPDLDQHMAA